MLTVELCRQLQLELEISQSPLLMYLQPGIFKDHIDHSLRSANIDIDFPDEVYALYGWKDGIYEDLDMMPDGDPSLFTLGIFVSLNQVMDNYLGEIIRRKYWSKGFFPLFESRGGDYFLIDTDKRSNSYGMILFDSPSNPYFQGTVSVFDSLDLCLTSIIECYREKIYYIDPKSNYLEIDAKLEESIWRKHNPRSEYYRTLDKFR